jgi:PTS system glucose-specific IIC component
MVLALGGRRNIRSLDACITRLRAQLDDMSRASPDRLKALGATGVVVVGDNLQAIFGTRSENLKSDIEAYLRTAGREADLAEAPLAGRAAAAPAVALEQRPARSPDPEIVRAAREIIDALGGERNLALVEACAITRLRVKVSDVLAVSEAALGRAGAAGVMRVSGDTLHVIVGPRAGEYAAAIQSALAAPGVHAN